MFLKMSRTRHRTAIAAAVLTVTLTATLVTPAVARAQAGRGAADRAAGQIVSASRVTDYLLPGVPFAAAAWRITYRSTSATGAAIVDSGTVLVPTTPYDGQLPLVGFAPGSQGLADKCAASAALQSGTEYEAANIAQLLSHGWAVAVPDYPGLGTPGDHTYAIGRALGPSLLDVMRAARNLAPAGIPAHGPAGIMGYSEGGGAAGWAVQLQPSYAPDLPLVGGAVGGVIANLQRIAHSLDGGPFSFLIPYTAIGMQAAYPSLHLRRYLTAQGRTDVRKLEGSCLEDASLDYLPFTKSRSITTRNLFTLPAIERIMRLNHLGGSAPAAPILLQQSPADEVLPYPQAVELYHRWCARGARVEFRAIAAPDHITGGFVSDPAAVTWLADRFAGRPLGAECAGVGLTP